MVWFVISQAFGAPPAVVAQARNQVDQALIAVGATPAQRRQIGVIADEALRDLADSAPDANRVAAELVRELSAPNLDPEALEETRQDAVEWVDEASRALLPHAVEAASVLTPAQRKALVARASAELARWMPST
jgi:Spy/CpxP family protein refolding chaperone